MKAPEFARSRECMNEFRTSILTGKEFRDAIRILLNGVASSNINQRMLIMIIANLKFDTINIKGQRKPSVSFLTTDGKELLKGFNFNDLAILNTILFKPVNIIPSSGAIQLYDIKPVRDLNYPNEATHVKFISGLLAITNTDVFELELTNEVMLEINSTSTDITLTPIAIPSYSLLKIYLLKIEFLEIVNGIYYPLKNSKHNAMAIVEVQ